MSSIILIELSVRADDTHVSYPFMIRMGKMSQMPDFSSKQKIRHEIESMFEEITIEKLDKVSLCMKPDIRVCKDLETRFGVNIRYPYENGEMWTFPLSDHTGEANYKFMNMKGITPRIVNVTVVNDILENSVLVLSGQ